MLQLPKSLYSEVLAHVVLVHPEEACGLLIGYADPEQQITRVTYMWPCTNVHPEPERGFIMSVEDVGHAEESLVKGSNSVIATYHSYTHTPAFPSVEDHWLFAHPEVMHCILSVRIPETIVMRAFRIVGTGESKQFEGVDISLGEEVKQE